MKNFNERQLSENPGQTGTEFGSDVQKYERLTPEQTQGEHARAIDTTGREMVKGLDVDTVAKGLDILLTDEIIGVEEERTALHLLHVAK